MKYLSVVFLCLTMSAAHAEEKIFFEEKFTDKLDKDWSWVREDPRKTVGRSDMPAMGPARVGVMAGGAPKTSERYVRFRNFRIVENP